MLFESAYDSVVDQNKIIISCWCLPMKSNIQNVGIIICVIIAISVF